jgi:hypothetical protein
MYWLVENTLAMALEPDCHGIVWCLSRFCSADLVVWYSEFSSLMSGSMAAERLLPVQRFNHRATE